MLSYTHAATVTSELYTQDTHHTNKNERTMMKQFQNGLDAFIFLFLIANSYQKLNCVSFFVNLY